MEDPLSGLCFFVLICFSAFFSATETAFFSLSPLRLKKSESEGDESATEILTLLTDKQKVLMTILLGNTLVNVLATAMAVVFAINKLPDSSLSQYVGTGLTASLFIASAFMIFILLIFAEFAPKTIAIFGAYSFSKIAVKPLKVIMFLFVPFTAAFSWLIKKLLPRYSDWNSRLGSTTSMDEIDSYFTLGEEVGIIERDEKEMINSVFEFGDTLVREVMIPRPDIISMPINIELEEMLSCIREDGHSRFPVYDGSLDRIVGILYVKDILMKLDEIKVSYDLFKLLRPPFFVPETKKLNDLLSEFQKRKQHMAMVVDEYGGVSGVVTIEDLLEEIVGEIVDEYDLEEQEPLTKVEDNVYSIDARYSMKDFEEELDSELDYEDSETVGGFILEKLGRIPQKGEELVEPQGVFKVTDIKGNRILRVRFIKDNDFFDQ